MFGVRHKLNVTIRCVFCGVLQGSLRREGVCPAKKRSFTLVMSAAPAMPASTARSQVRYFPDSCLCLFSKTKCSLHAAGNRHSCSIINSVQHTLLLMFLFYLFLRSFFGGYTIYNLPLICLHSFSGKTHFLLYNILVFTFEFLATQILVFAVKKKIIIISTTSQKLTISLYVTVWRTQLYMDSHRNTTLGTVVEITNNY